MPAKNTPEESTFRSEMRTWLSLATTKEPELGHAGLGGGADDPPPPVRALHATQLMASISAADRMTTA
jgi:hypothetical protein